MKGKVLKIVLIMALITTMVFADFLMVGYNIVQAVSTTNVENVDFDAYLKEENGNTYQKQVNVQQGDVLVLSMAVKDGGVLKEGKIKIENANFKIKEIENQYIKSINTATNEIELNQLIAGSQVELEIPIVFEKAAEMTKEYLLQEASVQLMGTYKNAENDDKVIEAERKLAIQWEENEEVTIDQTIEKWLKVEEKHTLLEQGICVKIINNTLVQENRLEVAVPEIQNVLPETVDVLINGNKAPENSFTYDKETKTVTITHQKTNTQAQDNYKVLYHYPENIQAESIPLHTSLQTNLYTEETIETEDSREVETQQTNHSISVESQVTESMYKGYLYANLDKETAYEEAIDIEVADLTNLDEIKIGSMQDHFLDAAGNSYITNGSTYIKTIKLKKENVMSVLGADFSIAIQDTTGQVIAQINSNSNWNEAGELEVALEGKDISQLEMVCNKPIQIGTLHVGMNRCIKGVTGYTREQLKTMVALENTKVVRAGANEITATSKSELKDTTTTAKLQLSNTNLTTVHTNENIQMTAILKTDNNAYDLYKNPYIEIKFPEELQNIEVHAINPVYANEFTFVKSGYIPERKTIVLQLQGEQTDYRTILEEGIQIAINADLTFAKNTPSKTVAITMNYQNEFGNEPQYETHVDCSLSSKYGAILYNNISGYSNEGSPIETIEEATIEAELDTKAPGRQAVVHQTFINNYDSPLNQVTMVGSLQGENGTIQDISTNQDNIRIYYSEKENATAQDATWGENVVNAKSYKIEAIGELATAQTIDIAYHLNIPEGMAAGEAILQQTKVNYQYQEQALQTESNIKFATKSISVTENAGIKTEISATSANKVVGEGDEIYEGQPIKYTVKVTNNTGKDLNNFQLVAEHTNAVYFVEKFIEADASYDDDKLGRLLKFTRKDETATNITKTQEILKQGETATFTYEFSPKKRDGNTITGTITMKADELTQQQIPTMTNKIKDAELIAYVTQDRQENDAFYENSKLPCTFFIENNTEQTLTDVRLTIQTSDTLVLEDLSGNPITEDKHKVENPNIGDIFVIEALGKHQMTLRIPTLQPKKTLDIQWHFFFTQCSDDVWQQSKEQNAIGSVYCTATVNNTTYFSNISEREMERQTANVVVDQQTSEVHRKDQTLEDNKVAVGDTITYTVALHNIDSTLDTKVYLMHDVTLSTGNVKKAYIKRENGENQDIPISQTYGVTTSFDVKAGENVQYIAEVEVWENPSSDINMADYLDSSINLNWYLSGEKSLNTISYVLADEDEPTLDDDEPEYPEDLEDPDNPDNPDNPEDPTNPNNPNNPSNPSHPSTPSDPSNPSDSNNPSGGDNNGGQGNNGTTNNTNTYAISGMAWLDQNKDGSRGNGENGISGFEVRLVNTQSQEILKTTTTNSSGNYTFQDVTPGSYIVIFAYNSTAYGVTHYHKEGVSDAQNSDVIQKTMGNVVVAATDTLTVSNANLTNIDAGFTANETFDLSLNKTITNVTVQNAEGTREVSYNKTKLAKVDIHAKQLANSTVTVTYKIEVKNEGDLAGYATDIIDYKPNDLTFNEKENTGWYIGADNNLHHSGLEKTLIQPGETKEVTLILTKQMTTNNTGTSTNIAEIAGANNEKSIPDTDSIPGNRKDGEDDISTAELIVSVKTGAVLYISIVIMITIFALTILGIVIYRKTKGGQEHEINIE